MSNLLIMGIGFIIILALLGVVGRMFNRYVDRILDKDLPGGYFKRDK